MSEKMFVICDSAYAAAEGGVVSRSVPVCR